MAFTSSPGTDGTGNANFTAHAADRIFLASLSAVEVVPVPEPGTFVLFSMGIGVLMLKRRRKK